MNIQNIKIKNIANIDKLEQDVNGNNLIAVGKNGVGKTSVIGTLFEVLQSKYSKPNYVTRGKLSGEYDIDLSNGWKAKFSFYPGQKTPKMELTGEDGHTKSSPRTTLSEVVGILDFDINEFLKKSDAEKVKYIFKNINVGLTAKEIEALEIEREEYYNSRTYVNKKVDELRKSLYPVTDHDRELAKKETIPVKYLYDKKTEISVKNQKIESIQDNINSMSSEIDEINNQIKELERRKESIFEQIESSNEYLENNKKEDPEAIDIKIAEVEQENEAILQARKAIEHFESTESQLKQSAEEQAELNQKIKDIDDAKRNAIVEGLNIKGLDFDGETFTFDGLTLQELNEARQYIIGIQIGAKQFKDMRIMRFKANDLDNDSMKEVFKFGKENNIQFFVEMLDRNEEKLTIKVEEE